MSCDPGGAWVAAYLDLSAVMLFDTEIEALRHAVGRNGMTVMFVPWGADVREVIV